MTTKEIISALALLGEDDLLRVNNAVVLCIEDLRRKKTAANRRHFNIGDEVFFINGSRKITGTLQKTMRKYCVVKTHGGPSWRVPLSVIQNSRGV